MGLGSFFGGPVALLAALWGVGTCWGGGDRRTQRRALIGWGLVLLAQAPWLVPALLVDGGDLAPATAFRTDAASLGGLARLSAGGGFWNVGYQAGDRGALAAGIGTVLACLAILGTRDLPRTTRAVVVAAGVVGWVGAAVSAFGVFDPVVRAVTSTPPGAVMRETQRLLALHVLWVAPAAVLGARRLAAHARPAVSGALAALPAACAVALTLPSLWGFGGVLHATEVPDGWSRARAIVRSDPGPVVALPWYGYVRAPIGDEAPVRMIHPLPYLLGGDVIVSSDYGLVADVNERDDPREATIDALVERMRRGEPIGDRLADAGVRWVVTIASSFDDESASLRGDPALTTVLERDGITVLRVEGATEDSDVRRWQWRALPSIASQAVLLVAPLLWWSARRDQRRASTSAHTEGHAPSSI
jgi:hypothetical protein